MMLIDDDKSEGTYASTAGYQTQGRLKGDNKSGVFQSQQGINRRLNKVTSARPFSNNVASARLTAYQ